MNSQSKKIRGSGGGSESGGSSRIPVEAPDSLRSKAFLRVVDLVSEGEIEGLVDGAQSIYLDETPLQNSDGSFNFSGVTYDERVGTQSQSYVSGFNQVENELGVNVEIRSGEANGVVRQITNPNVDAVKVRVYFPALSSTSPSSGDVRGTTVDIAIDVAESGGPYVEQATKTVTGKSSGRYEFTLQVPLTGTAPWNIRVRRVTADSTSQYLQNKSYLASITEVIEAKLKYPNSAYYAIRLDAQQFQSVPSRFYEIKALKVRIPDNATVREDGSLSFSGNWGGDFQVAWCSDPAWIFYDIATNDRYGLGAFIPEDQVDKWALYEISQYCSELVDDGFGATEPRFSCNLCISDATEAYTVMQNLASVFRGMIYWGAGAITTVQDSPQDASYLFTPANVVGGKFTYVGASAKTRHTVALVSWNDPEDFYRQKVEYVEDTDGIARYGVQSTDVVAFGCSSRGQAHRFGKWLLYTEQFESETVTFQTGLDGIVARPGQVIKIADPAKAGVRYGGRISTATTSTVTVDADIAGSIAGNTLLVMMPDGTVEDSTVVNKSGRVITVQPAYSQTPASQSVWILKTADVEPQTFRVIGIKEEDGKGIFTLTALRHDPDKYAFVEDGEAIEPKSYSLLKQAPDSPQNITVTESLYQTTIEVKAKATINWNPADKAGSYYVRYKRDDENYIDLPETQFTSVDIFDVVPGTYTIQVSSINAIGKRSIPNEVTVELFGKTASPVDVQNFSMIPNEGQAYLTWDKATDLDVLVGGQVRIRHTPRTTGQAWSDAVDIIPAIAGSATSAVAPLQSGTYMAKFVDSSGVYSASEAQVITTIPYALEQNVVESITEDPDYAGTKTNMTIYEANGALTLVSLMMFDDIPGLIDDVGDWDFPGQIAQQGTYDFTNIVDLGGVWPTRIYTHIDVEAFDIANIFDSRTSLMDTWPDFDGATVDDADAAVFVRTTEDDPAGTPTWTDWRRVATGAYSARGFQFQLRCNTQRNTNNLWVKELRVTLDVEDRAESQGPLTSGTGLTYRVDYRFAFFAAPSVSITAENMASGDYFVISNSDETGFDIVFKDSGGTTVSRIFYVIAKGYGKKVA